MADLFARVGQLRVPLADGSEGVGSGLLIGPRLVLTAAHVVEDDGRLCTLVRMLFPDAGAEVDGTPVWSGTGQGLDAALVALTAPVSGVRSVRARWGRLTGQRPGIEAFAVGFPRALREDDGERVLDQPAGTVNPGVGLGQRYDLNVAPPHPLAGADDASPWSGLSGAALVVREL